MKEKLFNILSGWGISFLLISFLVMFLNPMLEDYSKFHLVPTLPFSFSYLIWGCLIAPITEELLYRHFPFQILRGMGIFTNDNKWVIIGLSAMIFGLAHGGYSNLFVQGVAGFYFGWVYVKNGFSYWSSVSAHFLYNFMLLIVFPQVA